MKGTSRKAVLGQMKTSVPIRMLGAGWQRAQCLLEGDLNRVCVGSSSQGAQDLSTPLAAAPLRSALTHWLPSCPRRNKEGSAPNLGGKSARR